MPLLTALMANLWTFGAMSYLGFPMTLLTGLLGPMLLALGSVYGIHVLSRIDEELEHGRNAGARFSRRLSTSGSRF